MGRVSREHRQKMALQQHGEPEQQRKLEKYKGKLEKAEQHERLLNLRENERRTRALKQGIEKCEDADVRLLASRQSELSPQEAKQLLGVGSDTAAAAAAAKKLMA